MTTKQKNPKNNKNQANYKIEEGNGWIEKLAIGDLSKLDFLDKERIAVFSVAAVELGFNLLSNTGEAIKETVETIDSLIP